MRAITSLGGWPSARLAYTHDGGTKLYKIGRPESAAARNSVALTQATGANITYTPYNTMRQVRFSAVLSALGLN